MHFGERSRPLVLVLTDSLAFVGPRTAHPVDDPRLWPNLMAAALDADVEVYGDFGWTSREAWFALGHNVRLWPVMRRADAVVLAVGSFDAAPEPLPSWLWKRIGMIRSPKVRRIVSGLHRRLVPVLARLFSPLPNGGPMVLRPSLTSHFLGGCLTLLRRKRRGVPVLAMLPAPAWPAVYGHHLKGRPATERAVRAWAESVGVPLLDTPAVVGEHMLSGAGNPDGMHLGWEGHLTFSAAVAEQLALMLSPRLRGTTSGGGGRTISAEAGSDLSGWGTPQPDVGICRADASG